MPELKPPFYIKAPMILFGLMLLVVCLYFLQEIIIPFAFATILAILLNPLNNYLLRWLPRLLAISITVLVAILLVGLLFYFLSVQLSQFTEALPQLKARFTEYIKGLQTWLTTTYHISAQKQLQWLNSGLSKASESGGTVLAQTLSAVTGIMVILTLLPVYIFLLLLYKPLLVEFFIRVFSTQHSTEVGEILQQTKSVIQSYLIGLLIEASIIAVMNTTGLLLLGIDYAILLGVVGALLNIVPYIGGLIAILLPVLVALITKDDGLTYAAAVVGVYIVIQFIDNNIIVPKIVASKVRINAIISIIAVLAGGALCGFSGMFLALPFVAILKIIFDRIESLQAWGLLLGDDIPGQKQPQTLEKKVRTVISSRLKRSPNQKTVK